MYATHIITTLLSDKLLIRLQVEGNTKPLEFTGVTRRKTVATRMPFYIQSGTDELGVGGYRRGGGGGDGWIDDNLRGWMRMRRIGLHYEMRVAGNEV